MRRYRYVFLNDSGWVYFVYAANRKAADDGLIQQLQELGHVAVLKAIADAERDSDIVKVTVSKGDS